MEHLFCATYGWSIPQFEDLDMVDAIKHFKKIKEDQEQEARKELYHLKLLTVAIHSEPQALLKQIDHVLDPDDYSDEIGDMAALDQLKASRASVRKAVRL